MKTPANFFATRVALAFALLAATLALAPRQVLAQPVQQQEQPQQAAAAPRFAILEFEIEGNTVLPVSVIEQVVMPFMGEARQMDDVEAARTALEKRYQDAGFLTVFVDVPEQRVDAGVVRLRVTEGRVERLRVTGSRYYDQGVIRERVHQLAPGRVPDFNEVQRQLATLNREERQIQPLLRPGLTPGTVEAELKVVDKLPLGASLELNNRHAAQTDDWRLALNLHYDNLWQRDHSLSLSYTTAPRQRQQSKVLVANYSAPLSASDSLSAYLVLSDSLVEPVGTSVIGQGKTLGLRWSRSFSERADELHTFSLGGDYKDVKERLLGSNSELSTPLRYLPLQGAYSGVWFGAGRGQTTLNTSVVFGLRSLFRRNVDCPGNIGPVDQFECKRFGADGSFAYWRGELRDSRSLQQLGLPEAWAAALPGSLNLRLSWQLAGQPLVSGEQYALGGADTVRGYLEAEASGDNALLGSLEWRSPNYFAPAAAKPGAVAGFWRELSLLAFVDGGRTQTLLPLPEQIEHSYLLGAGFGLRLRAGPQLNAEMDLGWSLKGSAISPKSQARVHLRLSAQI